MDFTWINHAQIFRVTTIYGVPLKSTLKVNKFMLIKVRRLFLQIICDQLIGRIIMNLLSKNSSIPPFLSTLQSNQ